MAGFDAKLIAWLTRVESWRGNRRQAGGLVAAVLAALTAPEATSGRGKHDKSRQSRADDIPTPAGRRFCGGIAGILCPKGFVCVDDPRDDCDPRHGGADCSGICVRKRRRTRSTTDSSAAGVLAGASGGISGVGASAASPAGGSVGAATTGSLRVMGSLSLMLGVIAWLVPLALLLSA